MLNERSLEELSIGDLCREVDATTGALYNQFESKAAFFHAVQQSVCEQRKQDFAVFMADVEAQELELSRDGGRSGAQLRRAHVA